MYAPHTIICDRGIDSRLSVKNSARRVQALINRMTRDSEFLSDLLRSLVLQYQFQTFALFRRKPVKTASVFRGQSRGHRLIVIHFDDRIFQWFNRRKANLIQIASFQPESLTG